MPTYRTGPGYDCWVCGDVAHQYQTHMVGVEAPPFVGSAVGRLRALEWAGSDVHPLVFDVQVLVDREEGGHKAWAIWLLTLLEELEEASEVPEVAAEIENYLLGGFSA